jgi:hypothetical protein
MQRNFWKAALISMAAYTAAVLIGFLIDFRLTAFAVAALLITWTLFCIVRTIQLRLRGAHKTDAPLYDRETFGFFFGGLISSIAALIAIVVLSQSA